MTPGRRGISFNHMVKCSSAELDAVFAALADPTRRDILRRGTRKPMSIGEVAEPYGMSLAAVSKHIRVLEKAKFVTKKRVGKQYLVTIAPFAFEEASSYLKDYEKLWNDRLDRFERYLSFLPGRGQK